MKTPLIGIYARSVSLKSVALLACVGFAAGGGLIACSSDDDDNGNAQETSELNDNASDTSSNGEPGGDTSSIAGLWDGSVSQNDVTDVVYWDLANNGILTRYDDQQDGAPGSTGDNCYVVGNPNTVTPEGGDDYTIAGVAVTAVRVDDTLTITFLEVDENDLDENGDQTEMPTHNWTLHTANVVDDLNACEATEATGEGDMTGATGQADVIEEVGEAEAEAEADVTGEIPDSDTDNGESNSGSEDAGVIDNPPLDPGLPIDDPAERPKLTHDECLAEGGMVIGDIGNGAIHRPEYRCESGQPPIGTIMPSEGEPIPVEGAVCCL